MVCMEDYHMPKIDREARLRKEKPELVEKEPSSPHPSARQLIEQHGGTEPIRQLLPVNQAAEKMQK